MNIVILSRDDRLYSTRRLAEAGRARGHDILICDPAHCELEIDTGATAIHYRGQRLIDIGGVIPRIGIHASHCGLTVLRQFELCGIPALNTAEAVTHARDKLHTLQCLASNGIAIPRSVFGRDTEDSQRLTRLAGGVPVVIKLVGSSQGRGVVLCETEQAASSAIDTLRELHADFLVQEFIAEARNSDLRCLVVGGKVVAAIRRQARPGDFRSNLHRGGSAEAVQPGIEECALAVRATALLGLEVAGVDLLLSRRGPLVLEVNASPGLEGIEGVSQIDIAGMMIEQLQRLAGQQRALQRQNESHHPAEIVA